MDPLEEVIAVTSRISRDVNTFNVQLEEAAKEKYSKDRDGFAAKLDSSSDLITQASCLFTTLVNLRFKLLHLGTLTGQSDFKPQVRNLAQDINELTQNMRSTLSALVERNRSVRERYNILCDKEKYQKAVDDG